MKKGVIWINGASSGIGEALAESFASHGASLLLTARRYDNLEKIKGRLTDTQVAIAKLDIGSLPEIEAFDLNTKCEYGIGCLINNAGITTFTPAEADPMDLIRQIVEVNLIGTIACIKKVLPLMIEQNGGTIINILTVAAKKVFTNSSAYAASKAGLAMYSKVLREEVRKYNIRVVNIYPGATATPIWPESVLQKHSSRMMQPEELALMIRNLYENQGSVVSEEVELRPLKGDL
ncbi:MAG: SDR family NAD(P)-dependent oxidoreductase [Ignavibacteriaceae bacterium]|nr:SDR family NAD(P)-dependent oxidoreductase [Ignavibacteriaceae bacterium]